MCTVFFLASCRLFLALLWGFSPSANPTNSTACPSALCGQCDGPSDEKRDHLGQSVSRPRGPTGDEYFYSLFFSLARCATWGVAEKCASTRRPATSRTISRSLPTRVTARGATRSSFTAIWFLGRKPGCKPSFFPLENGKSLNNRTFLIFKPKKFDGKIEL